MSVRKLCLLALLLGAIALISAPGWSNAAPSSAPVIGAIGINDIRSDGILLPNASWNGLADLKRVEAVGVRLYRARMQLNCLDPGDTRVFDFSTPSSACGGLDYDVLVRTLAEDNMTLLPVLISYEGAVPQPPTPTGAGASPTVAEFAAFAKGHVLTRNHYRRC